MTKHNDLSAQAKQLGEQALKLANTARVEAGRYAQENIGKLDSAIDKATAAVERKTGIAVVIDRSIVKLLQVEARSELNHASAERITKANRVQFRAGVG